jgi:hypothetical protein
MRATRADSVLVVVRCDRAALETSGRPASWRKAVPSFGAARDHRVADGAGSPISRPGTSSSEQRADLVWGAEDVTRIRPAK